MENGPFEDVFPIETWGYSLAKLVYQRVRVCFEVFFCFTLKKVVVVDITSLPGTRFTGFVRTQHCFRQIGDWLAALRSSYLKWAILSLPKPRRPLALHSFFFFFFLFLFLLLLLLLVSCFLLHGTVTTNFTVLHWVGIPINLHFLLLLSGKALQDISYLF